jgi:protein-S-isoprenylcysteine O-methyltransferase Ste14
MLSSRFAGCLTGLRSVGLSRYARLEDPPLVVGLAIAGVMWLMAWVLPEYRFTLPFRMQMAQIVAVAGFVVAAWGVVAFRRAGTTVNPMKPESSSSLVSSGIYSYTRNPMYLGFLLALLAWAIYLSHPAAFLVLPLFVVYMNRFQIVPEERALASMFGETFLSYMSRVRRWL